MRRPARACFVWDANVFLLRTCMASDGIGKYCIMVPCARTKYVSAYKTLEPLHGADNVEIIGNLENIRIYESVPDM